MSNLDPQPLRPFQPNEPYEPTKSNILKPHMYNKETINNPKLPMPVIKRRKPKIAPLGQPATPTEYAPDAIIRTNGGKRRTKRKNRKHKRTHKRHRN
jgi:hypothetical protein